MATQKQPDFQHFGVRAKREPSCLGTPDLTGLLNTIAQAQRGLELQLSLLSQTRTHYRLRDLLTRSLSNTKRARRALLGAVKVTEETSASAVSSGGIPKTPPEKISSGGIPKTPPKERTPIPRTPPLG
jgi:hypothetical protein